MSVKFLIDMNLSPDWAPMLQRRGWNAIHWSVVGEPGASDREIMDWAVDHQYVVFTHDLDFGTMLALTRATGPSVIQIRAADVLPDHSGHVVAAESEFCLFERVWCIQGRLNPEQVRPAARN